MEHGKPETPAAVDSASGRCAYRDGLLGGTTA
jgi:hypothetical protein